MSSHRDETCWHVLDDALDPIVEGLLAIFRQWSERHLGHFRPEDIQGVYERANLDFALVWLEVNVSVDFARRLKSKLNDPLVALERWYRRLDQQEFDSLSEMNEPYIAIQWNLWRSIRHLRAASVVLRARLAQQPVRRGDAPFPLWQQVPLAPLDHALVDVLYRCGRRLNLSSILRLLDQHHKLRPVEAEAKESLAALVRNKVVALRYDTDPPGYGLPEWP